MVCNMIINDTKFKIVDTFDNFMTVPDCFVKNPNKIGSGNGEAKFYISNKDEMRRFYGGEGFTKKCFLLKQDLINYMIAVKNEYITPSQDYRNKEEFPTLWDKRMSLINSQPDVIMFDIIDQTQIEGPRGYVNSRDFGYELIRTIALPLISYLSAMELKDKKGATLYYWKLFADFEAIAQKKCEPLVFSYGKKKRENDEEDKDSEIILPLETPQQKEIRYARNGQGKYRETLLEECPFCPITMINDERILIASHIKPWAASNDKEKIDPQNGFMLSPLYDKLFDRGFITFTNDRILHISKWISPKNIQRMGLKDKMFIQQLPLTKERCCYLDFHISSVFHGIIE